MFRSPGELRDLSSFLIEDSMKAHVLAGFATGFVAHFEYPLPKPWGSDKNYPPVDSERGRRNLTTAMKEQILEGKMIGGPG